MSLIKKILGLEDFKFEQRRDAKWRKKQEEKKKKEAKHKKKK